MNAIVRSASNNLLRPARSVLTKGPLQQTRTFAADPHGPAKVNCWEAPTEIGNWKEEHIVLVVLGAWAVGITSALKYFGK
eukprot:CAMPEP_0196579452 /NCGR_PEP_ID=MMETSP1081-20130531/22009_1 /TAXON_ID=36882 /ORGANISM="Pyramimonas amylifera, Strain CCMP720" /LENGTH=79 /DNA_ID=CAMNT_0041899055 /DNA_START=75 /DNA_END=314 /DNA_ORIENTATION=-